MNQAFEIGGVGLRTQQQALDIIANNIANLNTPGFKRSNVRFSEVMAQRYDPNNPPAGLDAQPSLAGVAAHAVLDLSGQGEIERTGRQLDLAIDGAGFIELMGPRGQVLLWRGGALAVQADGSLTTADGIPLLATISVPSSATAVEIAADGTVTATDAAGASTEFGRIMLARVDDPSRLERLDGGLYIAPDDAQITEFTPGEDGAGLLVQGGIERSNVDITDEMIRLMIVQRAYAANAQIVQAADQLSAIANNLRK